MNEEIVHISTGETNSKEKQHSLKPKFITKHRLLPAVLVIKIHEDSG